MSPLGALLVLVAVAFLVLPAPSTASFSAQSLDYLNVQIVFPERGFNLTLLESEVVDGSLAGSGVPQTVGSGTTWGPYVCNNTGYLYARVQLKAMRQLLAMTFYGSLGKRPTVVLNLSPERGFFSSATWTWTTPTTGLIWNGTVTLY